MPVKPKHGPDKLNLKLKQGPYVLCDTTLDLSQYPMSERIEACRQLAALETVINNYTNFRAHVTDVPPEGPAALMKIVSDAGGTVRNGVIHCDVTNDMTHQDNALKAAIHELVNEWDLEWDVL